MVQNWYGICCVLFIKLHLDSLKLHMLRSLWLCFFTQDTVKKMAAGLHSWVSGLKKPTGWMDCLFCKIYRFLCCLLWAARMEGAMAGLLRMRRKRSRTMNDWSSCIQISSQRKVCPPAMHGRGSEWQSYTTGSSRSSESTTTSPQNLSWILYTYFKLLKRVASIGKVAMLFNGKFLPFYLLELVCWKI